MTEEETRKLKAQTREFPETMALLTKVRTGMVELIFKTKIMDTQEREGLFLRVMTLDALIGEMNAVLISADGEKAIQEYLESFEKKDTAKDE